MTWEQSEQSKKGRSLRTRSKAKAPKTPAEKARALAEKESLRREREEKAEAKRKAKEEKAEAQRKVKEEKERLAAKARAPELFVDALTKSRSNHNQLLALRQIAEKVDASLKAAFTAYWKGAIDSGALPAGVSSLKAGTAKSVTRKVFLLSDLSPGVQSGGSASGKAGPRNVDALDVKERLLAEFDRLNEAGGRRFYVTLFDLRSALPEIGRDDFDVALNELRKDWILTLSAAEGLHEAVPPHILEAGIMDQSRRLVYVARREA